MVTPRNAVVTLQGVLHVSFPLWVAGYRCLVVQTAVAHTELTAAAFPGI